MLLALALACATGSEPDISLADPPPAPPLEVPVPPEAALPSGDDADAVRHVLRQNRGQVKLCYEDQLKREPTLSGRVAVDVDIAEGRPVAVVISENTTGSQPLAACVKATVERWRFPAAITESIYLPFAFEPSG